MSITIHLRPEIERRLAERANQAGLTLEQFLHHLAERESANSEPVARGSTPRPTPSFDEMTGSFARAVEATGITEEELGDFFEETLKEVRAERRAKRSEPA